MKTYQDFVKAKKANNVMSFVLTAINEYKSSSDYRVACDAEEYDKGNNVTIKNYQKFIYNSAGQKFVDIYAANNKIASPIFSQLITQKNEYSLGNGIEYEDEVKDIVIKTIGKKSDMRIADIARYALRDGKAYGYFDGLNLYCFTALEFCPLHDENTDELKAGIRFYKISNDKPLNMWLYEEDGVTYYRQEESKSIYEVEEKRPYKMKYQGTEADGMVLIGTENYNGKLPIVRMKGNMYGHSELVYVRDKIDAYDLTLSGLANDIDENAFIYWIIQNAGGMDDADIGAFRQAITTSKVAEVNSADGTSVEHFEKDVPTSAREVMLNKLKEDIYNAFSAVDMSKLASGAVNEMQINAMFTAQDNKASQFEKCVKEFILDILSLAGIQIDEDYIEFHRQKLESRQEHEQVELTEAQKIMTKVQTIMLTASEVDEETILTALKEIIPEYAEIEYQKIVDNKIREMP